ncbi:MAG: pitrilysin family protein [Candidatus Eremiobacterota bacterium]
MYQRTILDNGLTVITERMPEFRSCSLGIWAKVGSRSERYEQAGLSHFLEHLLFKGTPARSAAEIAEAMDSVGGHINAFTEKESTCYYARVMDQHIPLAFEILADMLLHSLLDEEEIEREKGVVLEEIKMYEDAPDEVIFDLFTRTLWGNDPLGRPVIGRREVVGSLTRQELKGYMGRHYGPQNLLVAAAGQVDHDAFVALVRRFLERDLAGSLSENGFVPPRSKPTVCVRQKDCEQAYMCYGCDGLSQVDERRYAMLVLDSVLGGSMSSRLFQEIREKRGLVYSVGTFQNSYVDCGIFGVYASTSAERLPQVLELTRSILCTLRADGITPTEFERAREHLKGSIALALESTSSRMMRLARCEHYHRRLISLEEVIERIDAVTPEQVSELTEWLLEPSRYTLAVLGPVSEVDGVPARPMLPGATAAAEAARLGG